MTVKELKEYCEQVIEDGYGDKEVLISSDDEGIYYHTLYYQFTTDIESIEMSSGDFTDHNNPNDVVLLG